MRATAQTVVAARGLDRVRWAPYLELAKARLTALVLVTTFVGFYAGLQGPIEVGLMFNTLFGTALLATGAAALNQLIEHEADARMRRTQERPLPSGKIEPRTALFLGGTACLVGLLYLAAAVNLLTCAIGAATLISYLAIYTPLKRVTPLNTLVGAIPGALPPVIGWAAARGELSLGAWSLFAIQFFWQVPHFLAIAWLYQEDYRRGGFKMLPLVDPTGRKTARHAMAHATALLAAGVLPFVLGLTGPAYLVGSLLLAGAFLSLTLRFACRLDDVSARRLFFGSIIYLPLSLGLLVWDKVS